MLAHPITQTALLFGLVVASGLLLTLVNDVLTTASRDRKSRRAWHQALVVAPVPVLPARAIAEPDTPFKIITVKTSSQTQPALDVPNDLPKAA